MNGVARILRILTSIPVLIVAILLLLGWFTVSLWRLTHVRSDQAVPRKALEAKIDAAGAVKQIGDHAVSLVVPPAAPPEPPKEIPAEIRKLLLAAPSKLTLYNASASQQPEPAPAPVSLKYLPFGTLIPCKLVNTIDSNADGTPVIAIVLRDMCNLDEQGVSQVVIPAGTLAILDSTAAGRERDRIAADGNWVFVWRTRDENNGLELAVPGRALSRSYDAATGLYRPDDGRAGLRGELIADLEEKKIQSAAAAVVDGALAAAKQYDVSSNSLTGQVIRNPIPSLRNVLVGGAGAYVQQYADEIRKNIQRDGAYVQVTAGTEFYIFPRTTVDLRTARRGAMLAKK